MGLNDKIDEFISLIGEDGSVILSTYHGKYEGRDDVTILDFRIIVDATIEIHNGNYIIRSFNDHIQYGDEILTYSGYTLVSDEHFMSKLDEYINYMKFSQFREFMLEDGFSGKVDTFSGLPDMPYEQLANIEIELSKIDKDDIVLEVNRKLKSTYIVKFGYKIQKMIDDFYHSMVNLPIGDNGENERKRVLHAVGEYKQLNPIIHLSGDNKVDWIYEYPLKFIFTGKGLGFKIYQKLLDEFGYISSECAKSSKSARKVWGKLLVDSNYYGIVSESHFHAFDKKYENWKSESERIIRNLLKNDEDFSMSSDLFNDLGSPINLQRHVKNDISLFRREIIY